MDKIDTGKVPSAYVVIKLKDRAKRDQTLILFDRVFGYRPHAIIIKKLAGRNNEFMVIASPKVKAAPLNLDKVRDIVKPALKSEPIATDRGAEIIPPAES